MSYAVCLIHDAAYVSFAGHWQGFQDPGMNSFSHYSFGAVAGWAFQTIGGLRSLVRVALRNCRASHMSRSYMQPSVGRISVRTTADMSLPINQPAGVYPGCRLKRRRAR